MTIILITGGNRGIGKAIVQTLGTCISDAFILVGCRSKDAGQSCVRELHQAGISARMEPIAITITDDASIKRAVQSVEKMFGRLDGKSSKCCCLSSSSWFT